MTCSAEVSRSNEYRRVPWGLLAVVLPLCVWSFWRLNLEVPSAFNLERFVRFFSYAFRPAFEYQAVDASASLPPIGLRLLQAAGTTLLFASAGVSLALLFGLPMAFLSSTTFWRSSYSTSKLRRFCSLVCFAVLRFFSTVLRSIHELLWAVLFLAAFGLSEFTAVLAIALPYTGVFARVFADLIDEAEEAPAAALEQAGARPISAFLFGILPAALPNIAAYTLYRYECAVRSSAILGFFGIPTLGLYISTSFENLYYAEVWTYLYCLFFLIVLLDLLSAALRKELVT